jgi:inorganic pyrophosphatase/exopolyphosphatase
MIIVTSYRNPDLDGIACSIAYVELLQIQGKEAKATYYGHLGLEVDFVKKFTGHFPVENQHGGYSPDDSFMLVDTADPDAIDPDIPIDKVIQIYDHHLVVFTEKFPNAKALIDQVGSCSTIITEEIKKHQIKPSQTSALYLYSAIISNTINFKNAVTTERDKQAAQRLTSLLDLPSNFIQQMFLSKSNVDSSNFKQIIEQDFSTKEINGENFGIAQLEIANLDNFINPNKQEIEDFLKHLKDARKLDYVLFMGIDILKGFNRFIVVDDQSRRLFQELLDLKSFPMDAKVDHIIMRKQLWPKLKDL